MERRLRALDRLDARSGGETVTWPSHLAGAAPPRPQVWRGPTSAPPGRRGRRRAARIGPWWERHPTLGAAVVVVIIAAALAGPQGFRMLFPARAERLGGAEIPSRSSEEAPTRLLPAVATGAEPGHDLYAFMQTLPGSQEPITYDPCRPIHYVVRLHGHSPAAERIVLEAVGQVSRATGLKFVYDGPTDEAPSDQRPAFQPDRYGDRWAPVLVAWSDPAGTPGLQGEVAGLGGSIPWSDTHGRPSYVTGTVWLDGPSLMPDVQDARRLAGVRGVVIHELAHVLGAGHVPDRQQIMAERGTSDGRLGRGDRYVLARLGQGECAPGL